ncbi:MAG: hypothetical protein KQI62_10370, partial [Deltaproteobacteria bacterium]|nr:hypothetical protein [Deltaproteobacteria bacterium]
AIFDFRRHALANQTGPNHPPRHNPSRLGEVEDRPVASLAEMLLAMTAIVGKSKDVGFRFALPNLPKIIAPLIPMVDTNPSHSTRNDKQGAMVYFESRAIHRPFTPA